MRSQATAILGVLVLVASNALGQNPCLGEAAGKITCVFHAAVSNSLRPLGVPGPGPGQISGNSVMISQLTAALPLPSPASGFTYSFDSVTGVYTRTTESFGPALAERAETIGRNRVSMGIAFQRLSFDSVDGVDLHNLAILVPIGVAVLRNTYDFRLVLDQYTVFGSYGLTDRLDISAGIPMNALSLDVAVAGTIDGRNFLRGEARRNTSGLGDITIQLKSNLLKRERDGIALGIAVRTPTGDVYDGLGAGAFGVRPFLAASYSYRWLSPHANVGFEWNGRSVLAGDFYSGHKTNMPRQVSYAVGFDSGLLPRLTANFDIIGRRLINSDRVENYWDLGRGPFPRRTVDITTGAVGFKLNGGGSLLLGANLLFRLNEGGLRSRLAPLFTLSYTL